jgi:hypothetical protein
VLASFLKSEQRERLMSTSREAPLAQGLSALVRSFVNSEYRGVNSLNKLTLLCYTVMISLATSAVGQDKAKSDTQPGSQNAKAGAPTFSLGTAGSLLQSADDLRAASGALERFGESLEKTTTNIGATSEAVARHLAEMSSGFDPLGLQNAFKTIQLQTEIVREQQEIINRLQQNEIRRLQRENQELKQTDKAPNGQERPRKKKRNKTKNLLQDKA